MNEDKYKVVVVGAGPASHIAAEIIAAQTDKKVIVVASLFEPEPIALKFEIPKIAMISEPNNRRARRAKLRAKHKRK